MFTARESRISSTTQKLDLPRILEVTVNHNIYYLIQCPLHDSNSEMCARFLSEKTNFLSVWQKTYLHYTLSCLTLRLLKCTFELRQHLLGESWGWDRENHAWLFKKYLSPENWKKVFKNGSLIIMHLHFRTPYYGLKTTINHESLFFVT